MIHGTANEARGRALGAYLCTVCDHGMNASTFAARVVASTGSDDTSAVLAGLGALKGPLHGGAPGPVLDMLDAIGTPERAAPWVARELAEGRRIMGMGHRIYRVRDPRVAVLEIAIRRLTTDGRLALAAAVEQAAAEALAARHPDRPLKANVEFATAVLLEAVGIHRGAFTAAFAAGRIVGWLAHAYEQRATGRLIRPSSTYVGPVPPGQQSSPVARVHTVHFHGIFAPNAAWRSEVVLDPEEARRHREALEEIREQQALRKRARRSRRRLANPWCPWSALLERVFVRSPCGRS